MRRVSQKVRIDRDPKEVFALVGNPARYPEFLTAMTRWKPASDRIEGVGARFRVLMKVGSVEVGGIVEVDRWDEDACISWQAVKGLRQTGRWLLTPAGGGATDLTLEVSYDVGGGAIGQLVERIAARTVSRNLRATLLAARRLIET